MASRSATDAFSTKDRKTFEKNRLEFIKQRHHKIVLNPRYSIAEEWGVDSEDELDHYAEQENYKAVRDVCNLDSV